MATLATVRTVYLGTSDFAVQVLRRVADSPHKPSLIVTRPDRPKGRGRKMQSPPVADAARLLGIPLIQPDSVNDEEARAQIAEAKPDEVLICAFGALIKEPLLSEHPMLNVHPSLLPRWRGAAPIERAIAAGDTKTGVTIMRPVAEMDAGPMCLQEEIELDPSEDFGAISRKLADLGGELLVKALDERPDCTEQPSEGIVEAPKITGEDRKLDPTQPTAQVVNIVRALNPHVGTYIELPNGGDRLGVRSATAASANEPVPQGALAARVGGDGHRLLWGTADGAIQLHQVQPAGGKVMGAADWLRGQGARIIEQG
jgi:methionyl-tRNA formyltransferase